MGMTRQEVNEFWSRFRRANNIPLISSNTNRRHKNKSKRCLPINSPKKEKSYWEQYCVDKDMPDIWVESYWHDWLKKNGLPVPDFSEDTKRRMAEMDRELSALPRKKRRKFSPVPVPSLADISKQEHYFLRRTGRKRNKRKIKLVVPKDPVKRLGSVEKQRIEAIRNFNEYCKTLNAGKIKSKKSRSAYMNKPEYKAFRLGVLTRDSYKCVSCGKKPKSPHVHHVKSRTKYPHLALEVSNGITLCPICHWILHGCPKWWGKH